MEFVRSATATEETPGTSATAFSTWDWHAAQVMPVTVYCLIFHLFLFLSKKLFHQFLEHGAEFIHFSVPAFADIIGNAASDMGCQEQFVERIQRIGYS